MLNQNICMTGRFFLFLYLLWSGIIVYSQETSKAIIIKGSVTDTKGKGVGGVSINVKETNLNSATRSNGEFTITAPPAATLVFTSIGFAPVEEAINNRSQINITMDVENKNLGEVVVVGYGSVRKRDVTGSISSISTEDIRATPAASLTQAMQGRAAGVKVSQSSNAPGGGMTIRIRGGNSIQGGNEPLYVIDGYPLYNESGPSINPNDIQSVEILKDASATAIYGSRGANGVIIITTKRGKSGRNDVQFESYYGIQHVRKKIDMLNATEYAQLLNDGITNVNNDNIGRPGFPRPLAYTDAEIAALGKGTNWQDEIFEPAPMQNYQLTFSGGNDKTQYAVAANYFDQQGIVINSGYKRGSFRLNLDQEISERFKISNSLTITHSRSNAVATDGDGGGGGGVVYGALNFSPTVPVYDANGQFTFNNRSGSILISNPVALANDRIDNTSRSRILGNISGEYKVIEGLTLKTLFGTNVSFFKNNLYLPRTFYSGAANNGNAAISTSEYFEWLNENTINYRKSIGIHKLNFLAGYTIQQAHFDRADALK